MSKSQLENLNINTIITKYLKLGWAKLISIFVSNKRFCKEKFIYKNIDHELLYLLNVIRKYLITKIFNSCKYNNNKILVYGSDNLTSDYDLIIIGEKAYKCMFKMFLIFLQIYKNTLFYSLDVNLYVIGIYHNILLKNDNTYLYDEKEKLFTFILKSNEDIKQSLYHSFIKIIDIKFETNNNKFNEYINEANKLKNIYELKINNQLKKLSKNKKFNHFNSQTKNIIAKYYLYYNQTKLINNIIYNNKKIQNNKNLFNILSEGFYYSIESYYTQSAINIIVLEIQNNINIDFDKNEYLITIIENIGDFNNHFIINKDYSITYNLIKYSKYIYRICYCLMRLTNKEKYIKLTNNIKNNILPLRNKKENEILNINLADLLYNNESLNDYKNKINKIFINDCIEYL